MHESSNPALPRFRAIIAGTGSAAPVKTLTNDDLAQMVDTSDEWITTRTGIKKRHIAESSDTTASLAAAAAQQALEHAQLDPKDLDLIVVGTVTPEMVFPATACFVQQAIGASNAWAFDLAAACSGFVYSLSLAQQFIESGRHKNVMIIGADTLTKVTNWKDRGSCILFGDGAGATILQAQDEDLNRGVLYSSTGADGNGWEYLNCKAYGSRFPVSEPLDDPDKVFISIRGREIYQQAVRQIVDSVKDALDHCGLGLDDIDMLVPHQMNARIIESAAKRLNLPDEKIFVNIQEYGNTSAASIPIALNECLRGGHLKKGDVVVFVAFGGGLTWGANVMRF